MRHDTPTRTFWVDVEDLFRYFASNPRPSGIQRLVFETLRVMPARAQSCPGTPRIAFVRHTGDSRLLREVTFEDVTKLFEGTNATSLAARRGVPAQRPVRLRRPVGLRMRQWALRRIDHMPRVIAVSLIEAGVLQIRALRHARLLLAALRTPPQAAAADRPDTGPISAVETSPVSTGRFDGQAGDMFLVLGAPWIHGDYATLLRRLRDEYRIHAALLLYDLIPLRRPEWCAHVLVEEFVTWLTSTLPLYAQLLAISHATARDATGYAHEIGLPLATPVRTIPIGTGFSTTAQPDGPALQRPRGLPAPGSYVLFVATLEARKNHVLLFRVWRRLLAEMPPAQVPTLVFAGRVGWLVADLMQQLENVDWFDGKIRLLRDPTDDELTALYEGCQFTLFPSLFEGWGLPVSESLERGRPCIAANGTSLPEAGGDLARYFDPDDMQDAYRTIRAVIEDRDGLDVWRRHVQSCFQPVPWDRTADTILAACLEAAARTDAPAAEAGR
jgi:glycosyltransferase involved in cell wall biosynthesis